MTDVNRIVTLGVKGGPSLRAGASMPSSSLLELDGQVIVIDAGLGVARGLVEAGVALNRLAVVFVTHLHSDHVLELGGLIHTAWVSGRKDRIRVYGPPGLRAYWAGFQAAMAMDIHLREVDDGRVPLADLVEVVEVAAGLVPFEGLAVSAYRTTHPPVEHSFAYRFEGSRTVVFSGDTVFDPGLGDFASGADVLVHEALLPEGIEAILARTGGGEKLRAHLAGSHTMIDDVGKVAALAGVGTLVLNHQVPVDDPAFTDAMWQARAGVAYAGPVIVARDGMEIAL
ncbi:MAG: MBL fold metallo-hydrolase [Tabrizicola sp.]